MRVANVNDISIRPLVGSLMKFFCTDSDDKVNPNVLPYRTSTGEKVTAAAGAVADAYKAAQGSIVRFMASSDSPFLPELNVIDSCLNSNPIWEKIKPQIYKNEAERAKLGKDIYELLQYLHPTINLDTGEVVKKNEPILEAVLVG